MQAWRIAFLRPGPSACQCGLQPPTRAHQDVLQLLLLLAKAVVLLQLGCLRAAAHCTNLSAAGHAGGAWRFGTCMSAYQRVVRRQLGGKRVDLPIALQTHVPPHARGAVPHLSPEQASESLCW